MPNIELTNELVQALLDRPSQTDLLKAANRRFKKYPKKLDDLSLLNDPGEVHKLTLNAPPVSDVWEAHSCTQQCERLVSRYVLGDT
ncbi:DUF2026 family protein [Stenotrophomonas maltophilia]|uniref:DUF2026 domain-containing protein n=1 Tax=Stenotrophomonas maltophilia TaxID=40324 RepID=A0AAW3S2P0_STEMA|nr:DUF2026 domain-containing protein [Stenotrophomonas maltophilia]HEQ1706050.1 DUF2026 family protein [Stenotrophomonas maltophilia]